MSVMLVQQKRRRGGGDEYLGTWASCEGWREGGIKGGGDGAEVSFHARRSTGGRDRQRRHERERTRFPFCLSFAVDPGKTANESNDHYF